MPRPKQDSQQMSVRIPTYLYNIIVSRAQKQGCTKTEAMVELLTGGVNFLYVMGDEPDESV